MRSVGIYGARAKLGELVRLAAAGERVVIEVRGKPAAQLTAVNSPAEDAGNVVEWFVARSRQRKPWKVGAHTLIAEGRRR